MHDTSQAGGRNRSFGSAVRAVPARVWVAAVLIIVAVIFILQNRESTRIHIFNVVVSAPLWTVLVITVLVGVLIGLLARRGRSRRRD